MEKTELCNFADDNTFYACGSKFDEVKSNLEHDLIRILSWLKMNQLVANPDKLQLMFLGCQSNIQTVKTSNLTLESTESIKLLGITIDRELSFKTHIENRC